MKELCKPGFQCAHCNELFTDKADLWIHLTSHHTIRESETAPEKQIADLQDLKDEPPAELFTEDEIHNAASQQAPIFSTSGKNKLRIAYNAFRAGAEWAAERMKQ